MRLFVIGHYGGDNLGDELMLHGILHELQKKPKVKSIRVVTKKAPPTSTWKVKYIGLGLRELIGGIFWSDTLILGGGTHFHDDYNDQRYSRHRLYLLRIFLITLIFRILFKKVYYLGMGFGPFNRKSVQLMTRMSTALTTGITVRDIMSKERLSTIGVDTKSIPINFDLAALHPSFSVRDKSPQGLDLGISITSLEYSGVGVNDEFWYEVIFEELLDLYQRSDIVIRIFVFRTGEKESDYLLSKVLYQKLHAHDSSRTTIQTPNSIDRFLCEMRSCKYFIATRYHSAVTSFLSGCNILIVPYHAKLTDFTDSVGLDRGSICNFEERTIFKRKLKELCNNNSRFIPKLEISQAIKSAENNFLFFR